MMIHVYNNILVPYDGSQPSHLAMQHAFSLTKMNTLPMTTKKLYLLYVIQEILVPPQLYSYPLHELDKLTENYIRQLYQDLETKATDMQKIDLIIMGSIGLRGINKIKTLGSVSRRVSEMASCHVLIVH